MEFVIRTMKPITNVDKSILETALEVIDETVDDGTKNIYVVREEHVETDEKGAIRYDSEPEVQKVSPGEKFSRAHSLWARTRSEIEEELSRR